MNLKGSYVALVTPFHADGSVNLEKLRELCEWHIQEGTDGLVPLGTTGEASTLTQQEQDAVAQCVIDTVAGRVPVIVGAGSNATAVSVQKARHYAQMGADGVLAITPYYNKANEEGMVRHFETIADAAGVPVVMYNVPGRTACSLSVQAVERLARHPNIAGIKEASGNLAYVAKIARYASEDFCILSGEDAVIVPVMSLGGTGVISVLANVCPARTHEMVAAFAAGDVAHARALQLKYTDLIEKLFMEVNPIPVKEAMNLLGMDVGGYRLPLCGMEKAHREVLAEALRVIA